MRCHIEVDGIQVDTRLLTAKFCCDYEKCHGACCNQPLPGVELNGGTLSDYEAAEILFHKDELSTLCDEEDRRVVCQKPVSKDGNVFYTSLHKEKCVFCSMQKGTCVLKIANSLNLDDIDIPLSCQLYPILWEVYPTGERLSIGDTFEEFCACGYEKGKLDNIYLIDFLKAPIIRGLGEEFYSKLKELQKDYL